MTTNSTEGSNETQEGSVPIASTGNNVPPNVTVPTLTSGNNVTQTALVPFHPTAPRFGGIEQVGSDTYAPWTGGKPMADWSRLENPEPPLIAPNQYQSITIAGRAKSQVYRVQGMENKFT